MINRSKAPYAKTILKKYEDATIVHDYKTNNIYLTWTNGADRNYLFLEKITEKRKEQIELFWKKILRENVFIKEEKKEEYEEVPSEVIKIIDQLFVEKMFT